MEVMVGLGRDAHGNASHVEVKCTTMIWTLCILLGNFD